MRANLKYYALYKYIKIFGKYLKNHVAFFFPVCYILSYRTVVNMTKTEIVEAAFRVWGRNFYQKTSLSQLAAELGVSKPALYRHFENKQALTAAMTERFLDDFASSIRADIEQTLQTGDADEGIHTIIKSISGHFARDVYALIFSLINIYERNLDGPTISQSLKLRGVDMGAVKSIVGKKYSSDTAVIHLLFATLSFFMSYFHKVMDSIKKPPSGEEIQKIIADINRVIECGLGYSAEKVAAMEYDKLEKKVEELSIDAEPEPLFRAVAEAVAEAGPWNASMDMVAKRLGLSKSSLYGHFKNKKDMLRRLFITEFGRIIEFARRGIKLSAMPEEQLYLGIYSIAVYFRLRPDILIAIGWIRTRKLDLGKPEKKKREIFRLFEDVDIETIRKGTEGEKQRISNWILFLLINVLTRPSMTENETQADCPLKSVQNNDIRVLFKFITLGLGGFKR
jgi:AcrR family transcriptional regulator